MSSSLQLPARSESLTAVNVEHGDVERLAADNRQTAVEARLQNKTKQNIAWRTVYKQKASDDVDEKTMDSACVHSS